MHALLHSRAGFIGDFDGYEILTLFELTEEVKLVNYFVGS